MQHDQHFLIDGNAIGALIKAADIAPDDCVLEIGPGRGAITEQLCKAPCTVVAFEIDDSFKTELDALQKRHKNLHVEYTDALAADWDADKIVSNIPFSLSEPVLQKAIRSRITLMSLIVSEGFKDAVLSGETKVGLMANLFYAVDPIQNVPRTSFHPTPDTDCWIMRFTARAPRDDRERFLRAVMNGAGKTRNALRRAFEILGHTKNESRELVHKLGFDTASLEKSIKMHSWRFFVRLTKALAPLARPTKL